MLGDRTYDTAKQFIADLAPRLKNRVQLTTDGHKAYINAVREEFHGEIDFAQLVKVYGVARMTRQGFVPADVIRAEKHRVSGNPDISKVSTSFVERQNLTMRMGIRRFGRSTNAFSKKMENHGHAVALHFMHYNFGRVHKTLRVTPAMEAGISDHVWSIEEIVRLTDAISN